MNVPSLKWKQIAKRELAGIVAYIARDNTYAAQTIRDEIIGKVNLLPHHSRLYRSGRVPNTREMAVRKNYLVIYTETLKCCQALFTCRTFFRAEWLRFGSLEKIPVNCASAENQCTPKV